jgi:leucyl-tRNA synthetase
VVRARRRIESRAGVSELPLELSDWPSEHRREAGVTRWKMRATSSRMSSDTGDERRDDRAPRYDHREVEPRWQAHWDEHRLFVAERHPDRPKRYILDMFPYPSGSGLHVGHPEGYTATDILCRFSRMRGFDVLHPMGWDAFGLPAEQHAIQTGTHPRDTTLENIATFKRQLKSLGFSYDWTRELSTTDPGYVRWTQWIFLKLFERGLAYQDEITVNWCPALGTVLANEEVIDGKSERGDHPVERRPLRQWMLRITAYADRLESDLEGLDWPEGTLMMQREWIGKSHGAEARFLVEGHVDLSFDVFTTRPDTLFGATYCVLAPEHPLVARITSEGQREAVRGYVEEAKNRAERDRIAKVKDKTGVFTGAYAKNPVNGASIPIWVADYVLMSYGTGAIMAVPGHDERDWAFAKQFDLPIVEVVRGGNVEQAAYTDHESGALVNSGFLDGLEPPDAKRKVTAWLEERGLGKGRIQYKLRDWVFSRQRYWGEPIPIYFPVTVNDGGDPRRGADCEIHYDQPIAVDDADLPLRLPELDDFSPGDEPAGVLARALDWRFFQKDGTWFARETNTMPQWAGSCWYYLRFLDPKNEAEGWSRQADETWMPVDLYVGGAEHAVLHLLYARFWHKVLFDIGAVKDVEPFRKLVHQGMILGLAYRWYAVLDAEGHVIEAVSGDDQRVKRNADNELALESAPGMKVEERFVPIAEVKDENGKPVHPEHGVRLAMVAEKMSKSRGNVVNPDDVVRDHGADALRLYEMFMGPLEAVKPWQTSQIQGVVRFRDRVWNLCHKPLTDAIDEATDRARHKCIKKVTEDIEAMAFNTAISAMMELTNLLLGKDALPRVAAETLVLLLSPFAPHIGEELWRKLGHAESLAHAPWPSFDPDKCIDETVEVGVQVNGKTRGSVALARDASQDDARAAALAIENVKKHVEGKELKKFVYVPARIINFVVK